MNIVELIKNQLTGEVISKLGSLIGESEDKTQSAVGAAVPSLLSALATLATGGGVDKLISALTKVDPSSEGNISSLIPAGQQQANAWLEKGISILNSLLGSGTLAAIIGALVKHSGIGQVSAKNLLGYLVPLVLSIIAGQFGGKRPTAQDLTGLFAEQKSNIANSLPRGLSLADIPGLTSSGPATRPGSAAPETGGLPKWLLPLLGLILLGLLGWYLLRSGPPTPVEVTKSAPGAPGAPKAAPATPPASKPVEETAKEALPDATKYSTDLTNVYSLLTETLSGVKDVPTAEAALPKLREINGKVDSMASFWDKLPEAGKATITKITINNLCDLKELVNKVLSIEGVGDILRPILDAILKGLTKLGGTP
jgi:hypothetical protein